MILGALTDELLRRHGDGVAIEAADRRWTYRQLHAEVVARGKAHGSLRGRTVALVWPNEVELLIELLGLARAGAVVAPVKDRARPVEVAAIVAATGATAVVAAPGVEAPAPVDGPPGAAPRGEADPVVLLCTSGTTGRPKAASLTSRGLLGAFALLSWVPSGRTRRLRRGRDAVLAALPLTHVMGLAVALGALVAGVPWIHRARFDAAEILDLIEARRPNVFVGVPTMFADLEAAGAADRDLGSVQLWISGADAMPTDRARRFQRYGASVVLAGRALGRAAFVDSYGMVELSGPAGFRVLPPLPMDLPVPYLARPGLEVRAVDGELQFRGAGVMSGYRGRDAGVEDGWLATGDHGRALGGRLFLVSGRHRDRLKVGGFSVFPAEVEAVLDAYPGVREVALVGVPDERLGERPIALVVADEGFDADAFLAWAAQQVAGYRRPRDVARVDAIPRGPHDKIDRAAAARLALTAAPAPR